MHTHTGARQAVRAGRTAPSCDLLLEEHGAVFRCRRETRRRRRRDVQPQRVGAPRPHVVHHRGDEGCARRGQAQRHDGRARKRRARDVRAVELRAELWHLAQQAGGQGRHAAAQAVPHEVQAVAAWSQAGGQSSTGQRMEPPGFCVRTPASPRTQVVARTLGRPPARRSAWPPRAGPAPGQRSACQSARALRVASKACVAGAQCATQALPATHALFVLQLRLHLLTSSKRRGVPAKVSDQVGQL